MTAKWDAWCDELIPTTEYRKQRLTWRWRRSSSVTKRKNVVYSKLVSSKRPELSRESCSNDQLYPITPSVPHWQQWCKPLTVFHPVALYDIPRNFKAAHIRETNDNQHTVDFYSQARIGNHVCALDKQTREWKSVRRDSREYDGLIYLPLYHDA